MENASQQNATTTINDIASSNTPTITTTSVVITNTNTATATVGNSACVSSVSHQSGTTYKHT